jgi:hypothetical protein
MDYESGIARRVWVHDCCAARSFVFSMGSPVHSPLEEIRVTMAFCKIPAQSDELPIACTYFVPRRLDNPFVQYVLDRVPCKHLFKGLAICQCKMTVCCDDSSLGEVLRGQ